MTPLLFVHVGGGRVGDNGLVTTVLLQRTDDGKMTCGEQRCQVSIALICGAPDTQNQCLFSNTT